MVLGHNLHQWTSLKSIPKQLNKTIRMIECFHTFLTYQQESIFFGDNYCLNNLLNNGMYIVDNYEQCTFRHVSIIMIIISFVIASYVIASSLIRDDRLKLSIYCSTISLLLSVELQTCRLKHTEFRLLTKYNSKQKTSSKVIGM